VSDDWLNTDSPVVKLDRAIVESNPRYLALVRAFEPLSPNQKSYVRALPAAHYVPAQALKALQAAGMKISERTVYRWQTDPAVKQAVALYRELASDFAGIDALSVMLRVSAWAAYCEELVPATDNNGNPLTVDGKPVLKKRDVANGLKALELLGKHTHALGKESETTTARQLPAFVVGINVQTPPGQAVTVDTKVIDATFKEVPSNDHS
jgi:hypothetical protein